jgi:hypothetical protein
MVATGRSSTSRGIAITYPVWLDPYPASTPRELLLGVPKRPNHFVRSTVKEIFMILIHMRSPIQMGYPGKLQRWLLKTEVAVLHTDVGREVSRNY